MGLFDRFRGKQKQQPETVQSTLVPGVGRMPYPAYRGRGPYVFISYAHDDQEKVFAEIKRFNEAGYNVWYDEGIAPGNEWTDEIADALADCSLFVVMLTPTSAPRENVQNEINFALDEKKPFLAIHLEETELKRGLKLQIGTKQAILKYNMSEEEYNFKYIEAFTRMGLKRNANVTAQPPGITVQTAVPPAAPQPVPAQPAPAPVPSPSDPEPVRTADQTAQAPAGGHPWGEYVPKGTAYIKTTSGEEKTAVANSLVLKAVGIEKRKTTGFQLYEGLDSPSDDWDYDLGNLIHFSDMISVKKTEEGLLVTDCFGDETVIKLLYGEELWFIGVKDGIEPSAVKLNDVASITFDRNAAPATEIRYCTIRMKDGSFQSPVAFLWFSINANAGAPPSMKLKKDLGKFTGGSLPLKRVRKLTVTKNPEKSGPFGPPPEIEMQAELVNGETIDFTMNGYFSIYAMAARGTLHTLAKTDLKEIWL